jgi:hypothetical protein
MADNLYSQLNDLPNEILIIIFKYLHHHDVLYSFININKQFNSIINDTIIEKKLTLISVNDSSCPFNDTVMVDKRSSTPIRDNATPFYNVFAGEK